MIVSHVSRLLTGWSGRLLWIQTLLQEDTPYEYRSVNAFALQYNGPSRYRTFFFFLATRNCLILWPILTPIFFFFVKQLTRALDSKTIAFTLSYIFSCLLAVFVNPHGLSLFTSFIYAIYRLCFPHYHFIILGYLFTRSITPYLVANFPELLLESPPNQLPSLSGDGVALLSARSRDRLPATAAALRWMQNARKKSVYV